MNRPLIILFLFFFLLSTYITFLSGVMCCRYPDAVAHTINRQKSVDDIVLSKYTLYHLTTKFMPLWAINLMNAFVLFYSMPLLMQRLYRRYFPDFGQGLFVLVFCIPSLIYLWLISIWPFIFGFASLLVYMNYGGWIMLIIAALFHKNMAYVIILYFIVTMLKNLLPSYYLFPVLYIIVYTSKQYWFFGNDYLLWIFGALMIPMPYYSVLAARKLKEIFRKKDSYHLLMQTVLLFCGVDAFAYRFLLFYLMFFVPYLTDRKYYLYAILYNLMVLSISFGLMRNVYLNIQVF